MSIDNKGLKQIKNRLSDETNAFSDIEAAISTIASFRDDNYLPSVFRSSFKEIKSAIQNVQSLDDNIISLWRNAPYSSNSTATPRFSFIDLFAGIGGFRLALQQERGQCVFSSEWENGARLTYERNYGSVPYGDIDIYAGESVSEREIDHNIPNHDVLAAGFPCQPFSHAGVSARSSLGLSHGFECQTQGTLFYTVARIANIKKPKILFLENVKNIVNHDKGKTFEVIRSVIKDIGYDFFYKIVDSSSVVPQRRIRCYMVCIRSDLVEEFGDYIFPKFEGEALPLKRILEKYPDESYTISDKLWEGHQNRTQRNIERGTGFTAHTADLSKPSNTIVSRYGKDGKECLIPQKNKNPRKLTIRETMDLFGFPDDFKQPASKAATYKQFGNSVVLPVVTEISKKLVNQYF